MSCKRNRKDLMLTKCVSANPFYTLPLEFLLSGFSCSVLGSLQMAEFDWTLLLSLLLVDKQEGSGQKKVYNSEPTDAIPPSAWVRINEWSMFVLIATKEDVISSHPLLNTNLIPSFSLPASDCPPLIGISTSWCTVVCEPKLEWQQWCHHTLWWWKIYHLQFERFWFYDSPNFVWESGRQMVSAKVTRLNGGIRFVITKKRM